MVVRFPQVVRRHDDQGGLRRHVTGLVVRVTVPDRTGRSDVVGADAEVEVFHAVSGG